MKLGIVGGRDYDDYEKLKMYAQAAVSQYGITEIVSGGAKGADKLAEIFAREFGLKMTVHEAEWDLYGKSAGYKRNQKIWKDSDVILAFWDGKSKGTKHTIDLYKGKLFVIYYNQHQENFDNF